MTVRLVALAAGAASIAGCDKSCQNSCFRIYSSEECAVAVPGVTEEELTRTCVDSCEDALANAGSMGIYDPYAGNRPEQPDELENERMAAAWMECVWSVSCEELEPPGNSCHPIIGG